MFGLFPSLFWPEFDTSDSAGFKGWVLVGAEAEVGDDAGLSGLAFGFAFSLGAAEPGFCAEIKVRQSEITKADTSPLRRMYQQYSTQICPVTWSHKVVKPPHH